MDPEAELPANGIPVWVKSHTDEPASAIITTFLENLQVEMRAGHAPVLEVRAQGDSLLIDRHDLDSLVALRGVDDADELAKELISSSVVVLANPAEYDAIVLVVTDPQELARQLDALRARP